MLGALALPFLFSRVLVAQQEPDPSLIVTIGSVERTVDTNAAIVQFDTSVVADDAEASKAAGKTETERMLTVLKAIVPDTSAYKTFAPEMSTQNAPAPPRKRGKATDATPTVVQYRTDTTIQAHLDDLTKLVAFVNAANEAASAKGVNVWYSFKDPAALRRSLMREAFQNARREAEETADGAGMRLGTVYLVDAGEGAQIAKTGGSTYYKGQTPSVNTVPIGTSAKVIVQFRLMEKTP